ncbi:MAG: hypothetical protein OEY56_03370 [Cyclobacteriaceae bacterium]|nr:hypothetical protein [Cyclobacteriaceae bacterium]
MSAENVDLKHGLNDDNVDISELMNPFPGLRPFGVEESHLFFGREGQSDEALVKLSQNRFVAILGASGSGKSSFVYCGVVPTLHGGFIAHTGSNWHVVTCRPGGGPIDNLSEAILVKNPEYNRLSDEDKLIKKTIIGTVLRSSSLGLVEVIRQMKTDTSQNVLILVDQFEELFRFSKLESYLSDQNESAAFVNLLIEAANFFDEPIYVALTMRSDFIGECAKYPELTQMINDSHYLIPQMTRDQKRMIVEGPVAVGGGKIAPRLTQQLLNDLGDNPDQLPILQHSLMRTWQYWVENRKERESMDLRHYNAIGTIRGALSQHANEAFDSLNKREKEICEILFKSLTERGSENQGIRRPTKLKTIAAIAGVSEEEVERVVDRFREPGRSLLMPPHGVRLQSETVIDISHESLMRIWDRLKVWLDEESRSAEMYMKISEAATKFQEGKASLWKMPDLQLALNWRNENKPTLVWGSRYNQAYERTLVFLETSEKAYLTEQANKVLLQKRKVKFVRTFAIVAGAVAMVCLFLVVFANLKANEAAENAIKAQEETERASLQQQKAEEAAFQALTNEKEAKKQQKNAMENAEKARVQQALAEESAREAIKQQGIADAQRKLAEINETEARKQEEIAKNNAIEADLQREKAVENEKRAQQLRFQSVAQSMAIRAREVPDYQLRALVAKQGFDFYEEFKDPAKEYNGDIYAGAYYGIQGLLEGVYLEKYRDAVGSDRALLLGDSALNQYHGHKPTNNFERQVAVRSVVYSRDGKRLYSAGGDGRLLSWDVETRLFKEIFKSERVNRVVNISPNERYLALGTSEHDIDLFDLNNPNQAPTRLRGHTGSIVDLVFLPSNEGFISVGNDRKVLFNNFKVSTEIATITSSATSLALSPDGSTLAVGSRSGEIFLYDLSNPNFPKRDIFRKNWQKLPVEALNFSFDGKFLGIGGNNEETGFGYVIIWDMENKQQFGPELRGFNSPVTDVEFSKDNTLVAASSRDGTARMWDMDPDNIYDLPTVFDDHKDWVFDLDFHPNSQSLVTASADGLVRVYPTKPEGFIKQICGYLTRNMSDVEWRQFVAKIDDIPWEETCAGLEKASDE